MLRRLLTWVTVVTAATLAGCSSKAGSGPPAAMSTGMSTGASADTTSSSTSAGDTGGGATGGDTGDASSATSQEGGLTAKDGGAIRYPAGPYGVGVGKTIEDAEFYGYARFDDHTLQKVALHDFYNPDGTKTTAGGAPITSVLLLVGAVWCNPCVQEAKVLPAIAAKFAPAGVALVQDLYEGADQSSGAPATQGDLDGWMTAYQLPFPVFIDPSKKLAPYFDVATLPVAILLDAKTMVSLTEHSGFGGQAPLEDLICAHASAKPSVCP